MKIETRAKNTTFSEISNVSEPSVHRLMVQKSQEKVLWHSELKKYQIILSKWWRLNSFLKHFDKSWVARLCSGNPLKAGVCWEPDSEVAARASANSVSISLQLFCQGDEGKKGSKGNQGQRGFPGPEGPKVCFLYSRLCLEEMVIVSGFNRILNFHFKFDYLFPSQQIHDKNPQGEMSLENFLFLDHNRME